MEEVLLTKEGLESIKEEYERLTAIGRGEVAERIKEARSFGDLKENAEYDAAKLEQAELEARIKKLEEMMRNAKIIDESELVSGVVNVGNIVVLREKETGKEVKYQLVGSAEANPFKAKISNESAVGKAIIGSKLGDFVEVEVPNGKIVYEVIDITN